MRPARLVADGGFPETLSGPRLHLRIAGLTFAVTGDGVALELVADPAYRDFQLADPAKGTDVAVRVSRGAVLPDAKALIFDTEDSWALYAEGDRRIVVQRVFVDAGPVASSVTSFSTSGGAVEIRLPEAAAGERAGGVPIESPLQYPLDQVLAMYYLAGSGLVVHAAGAVRGGRGYCLAGRSGAGKSTLARLLAASGGWDILSDDRVVLRNAAAPMTLHGTPWPGEGGHAQARAAELGGLLFLRQGARPRLEPLSPRAAAARLFPVAGVPWFDRDALAEHLDFCDALSRAAPAWEFTFPPDASAPAFLEGALG